MLTWIRDNDPMYWNPTDAKAGFWALPRYSDVAAAYLDNTTFQLSGGAMLGGSWRNEAGTAANRMMVSSDPPGHRLLRQVVHRALAPDIAAAVGRQVARLVAEAVDDALAASRVGATSLRPSPLSSQPALSWRWWASDTRTPGI